MNATRLPILVIVAGIVGLSACSQAETRTAPAPAVAPVVAPGTTPPAPTIAPPVTTPAAAAESPVPEPPAVEPADEPAEQPEAPADEPAEPAEPADPADEPEEPGDDPDPAPPVPAGGGFKAPVPVGPPVTVPPVIVVPMACGLVGAVPDDAANQETVLVDVDNDGVVDTVTTYHSGTWRLRLDLANGPTDELVIEGVGAGVARVLGGVQTDFDLVDPATQVRELLVQVGANAAGVNLGVFGIDDDGCLFRFVNEIGNDLVLPVHDSIGTKSGLMCDNIAGLGFLARLGAEHTLGTMYNASYTPLVRDGAALLDGSSLHNDIDGDTQAGWLNQFGGLNCGGIELP